LILINYEIMKTKYITSFLFASLFFNSCKKDEPILVKSWGTLSVEFNKDKGYFSNQIYAGIENRCDGQLMDINMSRYDKNSYPYPTDVFILNSIPIKKGIYKLKDSTMEPECKDIPSITEVLTIYTREESDSPIQRYKVVNSPKENNYLQIDEYNKDTREIKGRFQIVLVVTRFPKPRGNYDPDTIRLTNGVFHTKVLD
jgi:hypothetical protein